MPLYSIQEALIRAGTQTRDQAIRLTGQPVWRYPVESRSFDAYGTKKVDVLGSRTPTWLIIQWDENAFELDVQDLSEEAAPYLEAFARMCDDWQEGDTLEVDTQDSITDVVAVQMYKVSSVKIKKTQFTLAKSIGLVPHRTDNF